MNLLFFILLIVAILSFVASYFQYKEKGILLNNAYLFASKKDREDMNKTPHYKQSAVVFALIGLAFLSLALEALTGKIWLIYLVYILMAFMVVFAMASSIYLMKKYK